MWASHVAQACLELTVFLLQLLECWYYLCVAPHLESCVYTVLCDTQKYLIPSASQLVNFWSPGLSSGFTDFSLFIVSTYSSGNSICLQIPQHVADAKLLYWHYLGKLRAFSRMCFGLAKHILKSKILYGSIHFNILLCRKNENQLSSHMVIIKFTFQVEVYPCLSYH